MCGCRFHLGNSVGRTQPGGRIRHSTEPLASTGRFAPERHLSRRSWSPGTRGRRGLPFSLMYCFSALLGLGAAFIGPAAAAGQIPLAIVVQRESPIENISLDELRRLFEGRLSTLAGVSGLSLYQHTPSRERFYQQVLNTTVSRATRAWMALVFSGEVTTPPIEIDQAGDLIRTVASRRSALGFVPLSEVDTSLVRIVRVDGRSARDAGYVLR